MGCQGVFAAIDLIKTDLHRLLVVASLAADAPAQVNRLKGKPVALAIFSKLRENFGLEFVPLGPHVAKGGAQEESEGFATSHSYSALLF